MKKFIKVLLMMSMLVVSMFSLSYADGYPSYLGGNSNYILADAHMGYAWYVDKSSLVVQKYAPPQYIIAVNVCTVPDADYGNTAIKKVKTYRFFYNTNLREMYFDKGYNDWQYIPPNGASYQTRPVEPAGEIAFFLAYHMRFYDIYSNSFYNRI